MNLDLRVAALIFLVSVTANAADIEPFYSRNLNPFVRVFGIPPAEGGSLTDNGKIVFRWQTDIANSATAASDTDELLILDGESYSLNISMRYGLTKRIELGADVPVIVHENGTLDQIIDSWHKVLGLPNGDRDNLPKGNLAYFYAADGEIVHNVDNPENGIGDIRLSAAMALPTPSESTQWALRGSVKIPTGDADKLTGSGDVDVSLGVGFSHIFANSERNLTVFGGTGVVRLGDSDFDTGRVENTVQYGNLGLGFKLTERWSLKVQADLHTAVYDSGLDEIGELSGQLVFGAALRAHARVHVDFSVAEDIFVDTAPDVVFQLGIHVRARD